MLELWAAIDLLSGSVVTLKQGKEEMKTTWKEGAVEAAARWESEGADGLHIIDLDAAFGKGSNAKTIAKILERVKIPVEVGGGVRSRATAQSWLESGASRVILGTLAYKEPETLSALLREKGPEKVVVASDYVDGKVVTSGWTANQGVGVLEATRKLEAAGVVNLLVTAVGRDGMATGPDLDTLRVICAFSKRLRVMASGGIRDLHDLVEIEGRGAAGAVIGRALYDGTVVLGDAKAALGGNLR
ncbi:MAG TPA: 1-(5-phosphoribosyl)-5-[(5-phosphoribosylamino)methylideneamino] imidazole-4-carboxamide isomerase [Nitrososphaerales archaeon]|nr:1-(5-phosphoribosyl)-5-[(5-phosphoribosylamino)methylideneamino] imidazole-4-carboxamide isomerase [Nitrososphaerales archaeon]